ncbi:DMT family transporter [Paenibacillus donghaensis]|uniref:Permease n=1 Tax=Paenibacillus donghaensis TaxID=414771 RepID=A0A2Z2KVU9_9BACL|nr:DMT family transporter [Paenibacillus donghaensis]ASA24088.1 permease [Paenibacillus donghaensis]
MIANWNIFVLIIMTLLGSFGGVLFKLHSVRRQLIYLFFGACSYGLGALLNIYLLKSLPYTVVMPANALTFLWTLLFAKWFFKERIGTTKIAGIICIGTGIWLLAR